VSRRSRQQAVETLTELGFTALEADVYAVLVQDAPVTAYKVAQVLGKAAANVYKAVESLAKKGALLVDDGESRMLRAVPPSELLGRVERDFQNARAKAESALSGLGGNDDDERVYRLETREQVLERAVAMLHSARALVALDLFPEPFEDLREEIASVAKRGVPTRVQVYSKIDASIPGAQITVASRGSAMLRAWPGQWLNVVVDATEHMLALMRSDRGEVIQAVWSASAYLSVMYFSGLDAELRNASLKEQIEGGASIAELRATVAKWSRSADGKLPGVVALQTRLRAAT
jgi:sugar-specific transcriptional regulator TrmB